MISITPKELELYAEFIHAATGIVLNSSKAYLLESRLGPLLEESGAKSYSDFFNAGCRSVEWVNRVVDAISTHETSFFRDNRPFHLLQNKILPEIIESRQRTSPSAPGLQIWSAACSTGQEVYSLCMVIAELLGSEMNRWQVTVTGTDISDFALDKGRQGLYSRYEVDRGVPAELREKYFRPRDELLLVRDDLRAMTVFKKLNLLAATGSAGLYDIILCRNVAIYFNQENRCRLFGKMADFLRPDGILLIGSTESLFGVTNRFSRHEWGNTVYFRNSQGAE